MTEFQQGGIEVAATAAITFAYYVWAWIKQRDCDAKKVGWMAVNSLGAVTGVFIFIGCFDVMKSSVLNGVWSGIAGIVITLATMTEIIKQFQCLSVQKIEPIATGRVGALTAEGEEAEQALKKGE